MKRNKPIIGDIKVDIANRTITAECILQEKMAEVYTYTIVYQMTSQEGIRYVNEEGVGRFNRTGGAFLRGKLCDEEQLKYFLFLEDFFKGKEITPSFVPAMLVLNGLEAQGWLTVIPDLKAEFNLYLQREEIKEAMHRLKVLKNREKDSTALHDIRVRQNPQLLKMFSAL